MKLQTANTEEGQRRYPKTIKFYNIKRKKKKKNEKTTTCMEIFEASSLELCNLAYRISKLPQEIIFQQHFYFFFLFCR